MSVSSAASVQRVVVADLLLHRRDGAQLFRELRRILDTFDYDNLDTLIAQMNRDYLWASTKGKKEESKGGAG